MKLFKLLILLVIIILQCLAILFGVLFVINDMVNHTHCILCLSFLIASIPIIIIHFILDRRNKK